MQAIKFMLAASIVSLAVNQAVAKDSCALMSAKSVTISETDDLEMQTAFLKSDGSDTKELTKQYVERQSLDRAAALQHYHESCTKGEILRVPNLWSDMVGKLCDFSKSIFHDNESATCVMR